MPALCGALCASSVGGLSVLHATPQHSVIQSSQQASIQAGNQSTKGPASKDATFSHPIQPAGKHLTKQPVNQGFPLVDQVIDQSS